MSRGRLGIFAKLPRAGRVKTRLSPPLSLEQAAELYAAMLADVLDASRVAARRLKLEPVLYFDPHDPASDFAALVPSDLRLLPQVGPSLGLRMANAFAGAEAEGCTPLLLRGSDSPALEHGLLREALEQLERGADVVLTPDQGGGYAVIGMKKHHPTLFDVELSTASVLDQTMSRAQTAGLVVALTQPTFDLDVAADLEALGRLAAGKSSVLCPRSVEFAASLRGIGVL